MADQSLQKYAETVRSKLIGSEKGNDDIIGDPIGREALLAELAHEFIVYTPEELIELASKEFAWCDAEYKKAAADLGHGDDWRAALEHVKKLHVGPGEQPQLIKQLALEAIEFLDQRDLVTIPPLCRETWRMEMMSPQRQRVSPFFTGGEVITVSFPTAGMTHEDKLMSMRGNNIHFSRATVQHELIPGAPPADLHGPPLQRAPRGVQHGVSRSRAGRCIGRCCFGTWASPSRRRTGSACFSGDHTAVRGLSSRCGSIWAK